MDMITYQKGALQTEKPFPLPKRLRHAMIGCFTEVGEFASQVKRVVIYGKDIDTPRKEGEAAPRFGMLEELADTCWYLAIGFDAVNFEMRPIMYAVEFPENADNHTRLQLLTFAMGSLVGAMAEIALEDDDIMVQKKVELNVAFGQLLYLVKMTAELLGSSIEQLFIDNNQKLLSGQQARYGAAGYSDQAAEARADKDGAAHTAS
ncbi:MazG-like pyrophosphatase [Achromobacter phage 2-1]|nr:MazG-like pyrophosphatase [Achromobacter phage 2-1]